jgi:Ras-related protein Rab-8A
VIYLLIVRSIPSKSYKKHDYMIHLLGNVPVLPVSPSNSSAKFFRCAYIETMAAVRDTQFDFQIKLLMIGDSGVGKTCLLLRYANDSYSPTFITTIGIDFKIKNIQLDGKRVKLQIWDTAGQERFRTITTSYFKGAHGILLVYDVTDRKTFQAIGNWISQIKSHADNNVNRVLIGNKCDMVEERAVSTTEGEGLAKEFEMDFFETSAKKGIAVEKAFISLAKQVKTRLEDGGMNSNGGSQGTARLAVGMNGKPKPSACC